MRVRHVRFRHIVPMVLACSPAARLAAQQPIDRILVTFVQDARSNQFPGAGSRMAAQVLRLPGVQAARRDSLLDGLERLAIGSPEPVVRKAAARQIAVSGQDGRAAPPVPGVMSRLARIYRAQPEPDRAGVRMTIRNELPAQAERGAAVELLRAVAAEADPRPPDPVHGAASVGDARTHALARLAEMGSEGRAALQAMRRGGEARSPQARAMLEWMASRGFPTSDAARPR